MANIKFEVRGDLGALTDFQTWNKRVRLVSWNGGMKKIDVRTWNDETDQPAKGIALSDEEARRLYEILGEYFADKEGVDV